MSGLRFWVVECDAIQAEDEPAPGEQCWVESDDARWTLEEARQRAHKQGWKVSQPGGKDYCPIHAKGSR